MKINKTIIIAEAGVNHNGNIKTAKKLIDVAAKAKADYVKFQTFIPKLTISKNAKQAKYQFRNFPNKEKSQLKMVEKLSFDFSVFYVLKKYCKKKKIKFLSSPFDLESIKLLKKLNQNYFKIPSGEITNYPYLKNVASLNKKLILSTGMSNFKDIENALKILRRFGTKKKNVTILQCNTEYPTPFIDVNLRAMNSIKKRFGCEVGYSDHTRGIEISLAAVSLGAKIIEKHITLNRSMNGPDHKSSIEPDELIEMIKCIRNIEKSLGSKKKFVTRSEKKNIIIARKSIVAKSKINKGDKFSNNNLTTKRPGNGLSPMIISKIIGIRAKKTFFEDDLITL